MTFLAPLFLLGALAVAVPVLIHLVHRERRQVVEFPSLMFLRRIPYRTVRRQRIRHWALLALRCLAILLLVAAFARPLVEGRAGTVGAVGGAREVVILLDRSYSMAYAGRWDDARAAARRTIDGLRDSDRATLILFDASAAALARSTTDRAQLRAALADAKPGSGITRYAPALRLASSVLLESKQPRREVILISDFQKLGWSGGEGTRLPDGTAVTPIAIGGDVSANVAVTGVTFRREEFSGRERVTATARLANKSAAPANGRRVTLEIDGRALDTRTADIAANGAATLTFAPVTLADAQLRGTVRAAADALPADDAFHFVLSPGQAVSVLIVDGSRGDASLYLRRALGIGGDPGFRVDVRRATQLRAADLAGRSVIILNDAPFPSGDLGSRIRDAVRGGAGLIIAAGEDARVAADSRELLAGDVGAPADIGGNRGGTLGRIDYSHPIFEPFRAPRSGDFSSTRFYRRRAVTLDAQDGVIARFEDGEPALVERSVGKGRVLFWASTLDSYWTDLPIQPVFLPFVHGMVRYAAGFAPERAWLTVGQVADLAASGLASGTIRSPSGERSRLPDNASAAVEVKEQGFYEIRGEDRERAYYIAANLDLAESDLARIDPQELVASVTRPGASVTAAASGATALTAQDRERRQSLWWYLLVLAFLMLAFETIVSNRLSKAAA